MEQTVQWQCDAQNADHQINVCESLMQLCSPY